MVPLPMDTDKLHAPKLKPLKVWDLEMLFIVRTTWMLSDQYGILS